MFCDDLQTVREERERKNHEKGARRQTTGKEGWKSRKGKKKKKKLLVVLIIFCMQSNITFLSVV